MFQKMTGEAGAREPSESDAEIARILLRLRLIQADMLEVLRTGDSSHKDPQRSIEHWTQALETIILQAGANANDPVPASMQDLLVLALSGMSVTADALLFSLHELTQLAAALRADAKLFVANSDVMTPLERDCIKTVQPDQVVFQ